MNKQGITVDIECRLSVSQSTAETCLKLVEMFINDHRNFGIFDTENDDGTVGLYLADFCQKKE